MLLQTLYHRYLLTLPCGCWQMIKHPPDGNACRIHFAFGSWERGTSEQQPDAKYSYLFKRGAKSAQGRNGINGGDPSGGCQSGCRMGRLPFMPDSALNRRSEALGGWKLT